MSAQPTPARAHNRAILQDLIDLGADLARRVHAQATTPEATQDTQASQAATAQNSAASAPAPAAPAMSLEQATIAFDRITRTVRRTIALANHLDTLDPAQTNPHQRRTAARTQIIRSVEDAIHRRRNERDVVAADLYAEFEHRLTDPDLEIDLDNRPLEDIIEEICRDLGVTSQGRSYIHKRRTPEDIAALRTRAETPQPIPTPNLTLVQGGKPQPPN